VQNPSLFLFELRIAAAAIVSEAGSITRGFLGSGAVLRDKGRGDLQTQADLAVEEFVVSRLLEAFPDHGVLSEESGERNVGAEFVWVLDPIDGTRHFQSGIPLYAISLALRHREQFVLGVVYNPESNQLFSASSGGGAFLNGTRIRCSNKTDLREATLCVEIPNRHYPAALNQEVLQQLGGLIDRVERIRVIGASALGLCYCASGGFDAYLNLSTGSRIWDVAAGLVILREAEATITTTSKNQIIGGPASLHDELLGLLGL
jgi:myo-inositol-1(or 4)-monophosphatase